MGIAQARVVHCDLVKVPLGEDGGDELSVIRVQAVDGSRPAMFRSFEVFEEVVFRGEEAIAIALAIIPQRNEKAFYFGVKTGGAAGLVRVEDATGPFDEESEADALPELDQGLHSLVCRQNVRRIGTESMLTPLDRASACAYMRSNGSTFR